MKAYKVYDREGYADYSCVVFAESRGKAVALALGTDEFPSGDWDFTQLTARRLPSLDKCYRGHWYMDWDNMDDRVALVREAGFICDPECADLDDCKDCQAKDWCSQYEQMMEDMEDDDEGI